MAITITVTTYSGTVPNKITQSENTFHAACDTTNAFILATPAELNTFKTQLNETQEAINTSESNASDSETAALTYRDEAIAARNFASQWASSPVGTMVDDGTNTPAESAYAWAQKSMQGERFTATSTTSLTIGTGSKTMILAEAHRAFAVGSDVTIADTSAPGTNYMTGIVTAYSTATDSMTVDVTEVEGSGTTDAWSVSMRATGSALSVGGRTADYLLDPRNASAGGANEGQVMVLRSGAWEAGTTVAYADRTSNTILTAEDRNTTISGSGTWTQTFDSASDLGANWQIIIKNDGTGDITLDPSGTETIDDLSSFIMYPGEMRRIWSDGTNLHSVVLNAFYKVFETSGTFVRPSGYRLFAGQKFSGGASGAANGSSTTASGGAGGACCPFCYKADDLDATETVIVGAGGAAVGGNAGGSANGDQGGSTTFKSFSVDGGVGGSTNGNSHGGYFGDIVARISPEGFAGANYSSSQNDVHAVYGGAATTASALINGGNSIYGGAGGGGRYTGTVQNPGTSRYAGDGGEAGTGGTDGAAGSIPGGGGGGYTSGAGYSGPGARGELRIWGVI